MLLAQAAQVDSPLIEHPVGILSVLLLVLAAIFWFGEHALGRRLFSLVPALLFCYFVPTLLTTLGVLPADSPLYDWVKMFLLPASLLLLVLALDVPAIMRLGPKAVIMMLAGTLGVVIGGPIALLIGQMLFPYAGAEAADAGFWSLPADSWRGLSAVSGSWIGGTANMVAIGDAAEISSNMFGLMVIVDVFVANIWMAVLLYFAGQQEKIDKITGADTNAITELKLRMMEYQAKVARMPSLTDLLLILSLGFGGMWISHLLGIELEDKVRYLDEVATERAQRLDPNADEVYKPYLDDLVWKFIIVTAIGVVLSFTRARRLDGAGASKIGAVMLYVLVASIGASASFDKLAEAPGLIVIGLIWMLVHVIVMLGVGWLIKAPIFFVAVGSQSNIGGAASAPVVAGAFHPSLAAVGALLAVLGYVLGTYAGLLCMKMLEVVASG